MLRTEPCVPPLSVSAVICAPVATGWRTILPMTWETSVNAPGRIAVRSLGLVLHVLALILPRAGCPRSRRRRPVVGGLVGPSPGLVHQEQDADERHDREEDPDEQDQPIRALQSRFSPKAV